MTRAGRIVLLMLALLAAAPPAPHVVVNGTSLPVAAVALIDSRVYVSVRSVGEALGAYVTSNAAQRTVTITTLLRQAVVTVDSTQATVNGEAVTLAAPPRRSGARVMLPLRALAVVFGASVAYKPRTHGVIVSLVESNAGQRPSAQPSVSSQTYSGTVAAVNNLANPATIQFSANQQTYTATIPPGVPIEFRDTRGAITGHGTLSAVRPGDALVVTLDATGRIVSMADIFASLSGTIASVAGQAMVLEGGRVIATDPSTPASVTLDGRSASFSSLRDGDKVTVRADPVSGVVREVVALTPGGYATTATSTPSPQGNASAPVVSITGVTDNAARAFRAGDVLKVALTGTAEADAEFDLSDVFAHNPMRETSPGHYEGEYSVAVGTNLTDAPVLVRLSKDGLTALAEAPDALTIVTTPPSISDTQPADGAHINIVRPNIVASFSTVGDTGMDPDSLKLVVNGQDVTAQATRTAGFISYYPRMDLRPGAVDVKLKGTDIAGNELVYEWSFTIGSE
jgi:hypothetical protein